MSKLISLDNVNLSFGLAPLLKNASLDIEKGERVCIIGRNGAGKSSLLKMINGDVLPDTGSVFRQTGIKVAMLSQILPHDVDKTIYDYVAEGLQATGAHLAAYHHCIHHLGDAPTTKELEKLERLQHAVDACHGWSLDQNIQNVLSKLQLNPDQTLSALSGGWQRRAALAQALVISPDLLLLDEPTNHLDVEAIQWLESTLLSLSIGVVFITHDRTLLRKLATRIVELDRGHLTSWPGDYDNFLVRKEERLKEEERHNALFDKKLAQEEIWIRQGIKARRTRNEGRVRALEALRLERGKRRGQQGNVKMQVNDQEKSGKLVLEAKHISHRFNDKPLIDDFSIRILRGDKIGCIGPNGIGKSTLLNILLGKLTPQVGEVKLGTKLDIAYFDQLRQSLDFDKSVIDNVAQGSDTIEIGGQKKHIMSYLSDFLFTPERARTPITALSGGECNRLLLARLFTRPANLLVMDEPTNDLDIETLELLEELLANYQGTLILISHDRTFLDNVVSSTIAFEGNGKVKEYIGGYEDWRRQSQVDKQAPISAPKTVVEKVKNASPNTKLNFKEQRELDSLPKHIETLEAEKERLERLTTALDFYLQDKATIFDALKTLEEAETELKQAYARWEILESRR